MQRLASVNFWLREVEFFSHMVFGDGIKIDPKKMKAIKNWPRPFSPLDIRSFLGLARYYIRFFEGFSSIATPLTRRLNFNGQMNVKKLPNIEGSSHISSYFDITRKV